jgi:thioredoxin-like negative regulator of GroEL
MQEQTADFVNNFKGKIVVVLGATWCKPCAALKPIIEKLEPEYPFLTFVHVDVDKHGSLATKYSVRGVPTVLFLDCQQVMGRETGSVSLVKIREMLNC